MKTENIYSIISDATTNIKNNRPESAIEELKNLSDALYQELERKKPTGALYKAMQKIIKSAPITIDKLKGAWIKDGKQYVCNMYVLIASNVIFDFTKAEGIDGEGILKQHRHNIPLALPTIADLKISLADSKKHKNKYHRYDLGDKLPLVDTVFLMSILEAFPGCECFWDGKTIHSLYFTHENGEAILLPYRKE